MLQHLKFSLPDWLLCTAASVGICINTVQSFLLPEALSHDVLRIALLSALVIAVLVICSYNRISTIITASLSGAAVILILALGSFGVIEGFTENEDAELNAPLWYVVVVLCAMIVYVLSRTRFTSWILLILGMLAAAYFQILEYQIYFWGALLFMFSVGAWICFVGYRRNMMRVSTLQSAFLPMIAWSLAASLLCLLLSCLLWFCIVRPLQPPTRDMILLTDYLSLNPLEQLGLINEDELYDNSLYSSWLDENLSRVTTEREEMQEAEQMNDGGTGGPDEGESSSGEQADAEEMLGSDQFAEGTQSETYENESGPDNNLPTTPPEGVSHRVNFDRLDIQKIVFRGIILAALLAVLIILFVRRKKIWYRRKTKGMDNGTYIRFFYPWYLKRLRRLKLPRPGSDTPLEYADRLEPHVRFLDATGVTWRELSEIFSRISYGGRAVRPEDRQKFEQFYQGFYKCCRKKKRLAWIICGLRV